MRIHLNPLQEKAWSRVRIVRSSVRDLLCTLSSYFKTIVHILRFSGKKREGKESGENGEHPKGK
jgi:hypothetical protein